METFKNIQAIYFKTRKDWRRWLEKYHATESSLWLIIYRQKSQTQSVTYLEAVEEALCYGWIDSKAITRDAESTYQFMSTRKPKGVWSKINKARVEKLIAEGLMRPAGQHAIDIAKQNGAWDALNASDNLEIPKDLEKAFARTNLPGNTSMNSQHPPNAFYWSGSSVRRDPKRVRNGSGRLHQQQHKTGRRIRKANSFELI